MGKTVSSIHIYTNEPIPERFGSFVSFSEGWQTKLPEVNSEYDFEKDQKVARRLSKQLPHPVLFFWEFDSDVFGFVLFVDGKQVTVFGSESKRLFKLPPLIGYAEGNKRRLSTILSCADMEYSIAMLEEYLGVCLEAFYDLLDTPQDLVRVRSDEKYKAYLEEEKRYKGKNAAIRVELMEELFGILEYRASFYDRSVPRKHIFYLAQFHTQEEMCSPLPAVEFRQGKLVLVEDAMIQGAPINTYWAEDRRFQVDHYPKTKVTFSEYAPVPYQGKVFTALPRGYSPYDFDEKGYLILWNERGDGVAFMDADGNLIAKCHFKGCLMDYRDGYLLTDKDAYFNPHGWGFDPDGVIRIYRIVERTQ